MRKNITFFLCLFFLTCSKDETRLECDFSEQVCFALDELNLNKKIWIDSNITSYTMNIQFSCYCLAWEPYYVVIQEDVLGSVSGNEEWGYEGRPMTINALFKKIENKIIENPFLFEVNYNSKYGYPEESYFDMDEMIADEEIGYTISNFKIN